MNIVLIHGGWQGGWAWDGVAKALRERGHEVINPTMIGHVRGQDQTGIGLADLGADVVKQVKDTGWNQFVVVGHSGGGPVAQLVAEAMPDAVQRIVFVDAWALKDGESILGILPPQFDEGIRALASTTSDNSAPMPPEMWNNAFMQDASPQLLKETSKRMVNCPLGFVDEPVSLPKFWSLDLPSAYIFLTEDMAVLKEIYEANAARLSNPRIVRSPGSHQAMITRPSELADAIEQAIS